MKHLFTVLLYFIFVVFYGDLFYTN